MRTFLIWAAAISVVVCLFGAVFYSYSASSAAQGELGYQAQELALPMQDLQKLAPGYERLTRKACDLGEPELCQNLSRVHAQIRMAEEQGRRLQEDLRTLDEEFNEK